MTRTQSFTFGLLALFCAEAEATPRLAATYGQDCNLCHVNPTGGGMRSSYVTEFIGPAELPLKPLPAHDQSKWPKAKLNDNISVGTDLRLLYLATNDNQTVAGKLDNTFFQMQADFYVSFEPDPQFVLYLDRGTGTDYEVFALARVLPAHGYLKGGRFVPDVGWRWDDHNHYTRSWLGLGYPGATQTGIELGVHPGALSLTTGLYNGNDGGQFDDNRQKMATARALYRWHVAGVNAALGGSTRWNVSRVGKERLWGVQAEVGWRKFAYIGEVFGQRIANSPDVDTTLNSRERTWSLVVTHEVDVRPIQGLDIYLAYDYRDPDLDLETGTRYQVSLGSRVYLRHFLEFEPILRYERDEVAGVRTNDTRVELLLHGFY